MFHLRELVDANRKEIAPLLTAEHGKVLGDALGEVARGLENIEFACGIPNLLKGGYSEQARTGVDVYSIRQPLGVVAGITPFNFPAMVPMWMFANAIACGNTFVLKPSEKDPSASLFIADLLKQAGLPDGVFNVVQGDKVAVDRILEHPDIAAVSFVGSTPIARYIYETGTSNGKRVQALGGAKNHMVVLPDADIDMAADAAVSAGYGSAGERCMAISVVVAVGAVADPLVDAIKARLPKLKVGPGSSPTARWARSSPASTGTRWPATSTAPPSRGPRSVVDGRTQRCRATASSSACRSSTTSAEAMDCYRDEIFGPVLSVVRVDTYDEALHLSTTTRTATARRSSPATAARPASSSSTQRRHGRRQRAHPGARRPTTASAGWKASLFGDLHMYGPDGIQFYTRTKVVTSRWPDPSTSTVDLGFPQVR